MRGKLVAISRIYKADVRYISIVVPRPSLDDEASRTNWKPQKFRSGTVGPCGTDSELRRAPRDAIDKPSAWRNGLKCFLHDLRNRGDTYQTIFYAKRFASGEMQKLQGQNLIFGLEIEQPPIGGSCFALLAL